MYFIEKIVFKQKIKRRHSAAKKNHTKELYRLQNGKINRISQFLQEYFNEMNKQKRLLTDFRQYLPFFTLWNI